MELKKRVEQLLARIAAMQIPIYAGNASFFLLLSVFPIVSLLLTGQRRADALVGLKGDVEPFVRA